MAVTTQRHDAWKAQRYAAVGVGEYWLVDVPSRSVTVHRGPRPDVYAEVSAHGDGERIPTSVGAPPVDVSALLGPRA